MARRSQSTLLTKIGAINGGKHTIENTLAKLIVGLSGGLSTQEIVAYFQAA